MSEKIRIGMIGCGGIMGCHVQRLLEMPEVEIVALNDTSAVSIEKMKTSFPAVKDLPVYENYMDMLENEKLDAVEIATPHTLHFQQAMDALDKGLHVLIEKPMVCTVEDAKKLIAQAKLMDKIIVLSYQRHYDPSFRYMKKVIDDGQLGAVTFVSVLQCQDWKNAVANTWRQIPELSGGGQLNDSGSHLLDIMLWMTGLTVDVVSAYIDNRGRLVDINSALSLKFTNGAQGTVSVVGEAPTWWEDITIWGEQGVLFMRNGQLTHIGADGKPVTIETLPDAGNPDKNLVDAILGRDEVWTPPICGLRTIELTQAAWKSAELGKAVSVDTL